MKFEAVKGMRDFLPKQAKKKQFIEDVCRKTFERYGFEPLQSPIIEDFAVLAAKNSAGEAIKEEIYYFKDKADRELGLRFDFTVPLARIVSSNSSLQKPFRRYCIGTVYRYDRPGAKRYREFTQADVDIVGAKSVLADFECIQIGSDVMRSLGFDFSIKVNNRAVLEELSKKCGIEDGQIKEAFRSIDKMDKIGETGVRKEFKEKNLNEKILEKIFTNSFDEVNEILAGSQAVKELEMLLNLARENNVSEVRFDLSLARGLEYYTGNVFEISITEGPSVGGGGRYDKLIEVYGGPSTPAVGISFGIDRLFDSLESTVVVGANTDIFIAPLSDEMNSPATKLAASFRKLGLAAEIDLMARNMKKNLEYVNRKGIWFFIVLGENELKSGKAKIKDMGTGQEIEFALDDAKAAAAFVRK